MLRALVSQAPRKPTCCRQSRVTPSVHPRATSLARIELEVHGISAQPPALWSPLGRSHRGCVPPPARLHPLRRPCRAPLPCPLAGAVQKPTSWMLCCNFYRRGPLSDPKHLHAVNQYLRLLQAASWVQRSRTDGKGVTYSHAPLGDGEKGRHGCVNVAECSYTDLGGVTHSKARLCGLPSSCTWSVSTQMSSQSSWLYLLFICGIRCPVDTQCSLGILSWSLQAT